MTVPPLFLGLDVGTQSVRAALFDLAGSCRAFATAPLDTFHPHPTWAEQDPAQWWRAIQTAVPAALAKAGCKAEDVAGIGLDCTACTVLPCTQDGTPLRHALLWMDQRAFREAEEISGSGDPSLKYVSDVVSPEWMLPKALWLKRNEPALYGQAARVIECTDWLMYHLTGEWTLSLNHVAVKWNHVRPEGGWSPALLGQVGLDDLAGKWPEQIVPLGAGAGRLSTSAAQQLGLRPRTPVAQGGIDAYLGMLGLGATGAGDLAMIMGSSTCHLAMSALPLLGSGMLGCYPDAVVEGLYTLEGGQTATGSILNWYRQHFAGHEEAEAARTGRNVYEILDEKAASVPAGSEGVVCLDYWQGNRCPHKDPRARGAFWGLTLAHGPGHLFRSIYEGTALGTRAILDDLRPHGFMMHRLFAGGGGARSRLWLQIHADVLEQAIHVPTEPDACALGSALVAAVHTGHFASFDEAAGSMVQIAEQIEPGPENRAVYEDLVGKYRETYSALRGLMHGDFNPRG
jgi:FGGY-family pentulose kinase